MASVYIVGGTEDLATEVLAELVARGHESELFHLMNASDESGEFVSTPQGRVRVQSVSEELLADADAVIFLGDGLLAKDLLPAVAERGTLVVDATPFSRRMGTGRLVLPEVNGEALATPGENQVFAYPMASTSGLATALAPLHACAGIRRVVTTVFEPASQRGAQGIEDLSRQSVAMVSGEGVDREKYPETFAFNVRPQAAGVAGDGWSFDERMIAEEISLLFPAPAFDVFATVTRVPVFVGAAQSVLVEFQRPLRLEEATEALREAPSVLMASDVLPEGMDPEAGELLLDHEAGPLDVAGSGAVHVGRLRMDPHRSDTLGFWLAFDDLRKGVAIGVASIFERTWGSLGGGY